MQTIAPSDSKFLHKRWLHSQASVDIRSKVFYDDTVDGGSGIRQEHSIYLAASSYLQLLPNGLEWKNTFSDWIANIVFPFVSQKPSWENEKKLSARSSARRAKLQGAQERKAKKTCRIKTMSAKAKLCTKFVNIELSFYICTTNQNTFWTFAHQNLVRSNLV